MVKLFLVLSLLTPSLSFAVDCKQNVQVIKVGEVAQCDGFLFSPQAEKKASQAVDDLKYYQDLSKLLHDRNDLKDKELSIQDQRLTLYMNSSRDLAEQVTRKEHEDFWQKTIYFFLGAGIMYGASQVYK